VVANRGFEVLLPSSGRTDRSRALCNNRTPGGGGLAPGLTTIRPFRPRTMNTIQASARLHESTDQIFVLQCSMIVN
jgi:hypothetical protein